MERGFGETYSSGEIPIYFLTGFTGKNGITYHPKTKSKRGDKFLEGKKEEGENTVRMLLLITKNLLPFFQSFIQIHFRQKNLGSDK